MQPPCNGSTPSTSRFRIYARTVRNEFLHVWGVLWKKSEFQGGGPDQSTVAWWLYFDMQPLIFLFIYLDWHIHSHIQFVSLLLLEAEKPRHQSDPSLFSNDLLIILFEKQRLLERFCLLQGQTLRTSTPHKIVLAGSPWPKLPETTPSRWTKVKISAEGDLATGLWEVTCLKRALRALWPPTALRSNLLSVPQSLFLTFFHNLHCCRVLWGCQDVCGVELRKVWPRKRLRTIQRAGTTH